MATATFRARNKKFYRGSAGKWLMSMDGQACRVLGTKTYPSDQTGTGKPLDVVFIRFANSGRLFQVRPCDVE